MKISKQEQIVIVVLIVLAILGAGLFIFILPNFNQIDVNNKALANVQAEYDGYVSELEHEKTIDSEIKQAYDEAKNLANGFYSDMTPYEADETMRHYLEKVKEDISIDGLEVGPMSTATLSVSLFAPENVTYPLKDFANTVVQSQAPEIDITTLSERQQEIAAKDLYSMALSASSAVTVGCSTVNFHAYSKDLDSLHALVDLLNDGIFDETVLDAKGNPQRKANYISNVEFELMDRSSDFVDKEESNDSKTESSENSNQDDSDNIDKSGMYVMDFSVQFFCIQPVDNPFGEGAAE